MEKKSGIIIGILIGIVIMALVNTVLFTTKAISFTLPKSETEELIENKTNEITDKAEKIIDKVEEKINENTESGETTISQSKFVNIVLSDNKQSYHLILWNDGTYEYTGEEAKSGTLGTYILTDNKLTLNYLFEINDNKVIVKSGTKTLNITKGPQYDQYIDGSLILHSVNQAAGEGGRSFYTELYYLLKFYNDEQRKNLGID